MIHCREVLCHSLPITFCCFGYLFQAAATAIGNFAWKSQSVADKAGDFCIVSQNKCWKKYAQEKDTPRSS